MPHALPSLQRRLWLLVLGSTLPLVVLTAALVQFNYRTERQRFDENTIATARAVAMNVDERMQDLGRTLAELARSQVLAVGDLKRFHAEARGVQALEGLDSILLSDVSGQLLLDSQQAADAVPRGIAWVPTSAQGPVPAIPLASGSGGPGPRPDSALPRAWIRPMHRGFQGKQQVGAAVPVAIQGNPGYLLQGNVSPERLRDLLMRQRMPEDWLVILIDSNGIVVARTRGHDLYSGKSVLPDTLAPLRMRDEGLMESVMLDGERSMMAFSRSPYAGWWVGIARPADEALLPLWQSMGVLVAVAVAVLALSLGLAWWIGHRLVSTMQGLAGAARDLGTARVAPVPAASFAEAEALRQALQDAGSALGLAHDELARSEARQRAIVETALDAVIGLDAHGQVMLFNAAAEHMLGWRRDEVMGTSVNELLHEQFRSEHPSSMFGGSEYAEPLPPGTGRTILARHRDGHDIPAEASISVAEHEGTHIQTVILRDITERLRDRDALIRSNLEQRQFAFVASHDLRSPIKTVEGYLRLLASRHGAELGAERLHMVERALRAIEHMDRLTADLLAYARLDAAEQPLAMVDCNELVREAQTLLADRIEATAAVLEVQLLPQLIGDRTQLIQVFQNLLSNAIKYVQAGPPRVRVSAERRGGGWVLSVADNGIGVPLEHRQRVFEIFQRLHTQQEYPGTGIGLAMCRRVIERHGGQIWVEDGPAGGSCFRFFVPDAPGLS